MHCPACKHVMIVVERNRVELDYCTNCRGVWFDSGELELLLQSSGTENRESFIAGMLKAPEAIVDEKKRKCPICRRAMKKVAVSGQSPVHIDACPAGNGLWFDGGEFDVLVKELNKKTGSQAPVASFLSEVFPAKSKLGG